MGDFETDASRYTMHRVSRSPKEEVMFPKARKMLKFQEKCDALKPEKPTENQVKIRSDSSTPRRPFTPRSSGKQRPYREGAGVDELVKYMSNVPAYLQLLQRGDRNQEKALNVGVLDWSRLQKWSNSQRPVGSQRECESPSIRNTGSPYRQSRRNNGVSSLGSRRAPSSTSGHHHSSCSEKDHSRRGVQKISRQFRSFLTLGSESPTTSAAQKVVDRNPSGNNIELSVEDPGTTTNSTAFSTQECDACSSNTSNCRDCGISFPVNGNSRSHDSKLRKEKVLVSEYEQETCSNSSVHADDFSQDFSNIDDEHFDSPWRYFLDQGSANHRFSFGGLDKLKTDLNQSSFSGILLGDSPFVPLSSDVPFSCPLPSNNESSRWPDTHEENSKNGQGASTPAKESEDISAEGCDVDNSIEIMATLPQLYINRTQNEKANSVYKAATTKVRESLLNYRTVSRTKVMLRGSSLREVAAPEQMKGYGFVDSFVIDKETPTSRARRSPLRRMLDPLLKSKSLNHHQETISSLPMNIVRRLSFSGKRSLEGETAPKRKQENSPANSVISSGSHNGNNYTHSNLVAANSHSPLEGEKHEISKNQALLRLAWKNGQPLFTFSMNDTDILAATRKKTVSDKEDLECIYTFYYVREIKKKSTGWINQGNKRTALIYNVVGRMNVRSSRSSVLSGDTNMIAKEFVLLGSELRPMPLQAPPSVLMNELAAIVVRTPKQRTPSIDLSTLHRQCKVELTMDKCQCCVTENGTTDAKIVCSSIVALLPSEVHGLSDGGFPSPLIERWKSGGHCDCGGWDVGCPLTILTENSNGNSRSHLVQSSCNTDGTHQVKLFAQGGGATKAGPVFSLVPFREGLYTVDFDSSIAILQAFSVCIAIMHGKKPQSLSEVHSNIQHASSEEKEPSSLQGNTAPPSYVPHHPPLSPVGRA